VFHANLETRSFRFNAFDITAEGAILALKAGLQKHATQYLAHEPEKIDQWVQSLAQDANVTAFKAGDCFRDYTVIVRSSDPAPSPDADNVRPD
jgi:hypothetical protein